jgi:hypothetical protein
VLGDAMDLASLVILKKNGLGGHYGSHFEEYSSRLKDLRGSRDRKLEAVYQDVRHGMRDVRATIQEQLTYAARSLHRGFQKWVFQLLI